MFGQVLARPSPVQFKSPYQSLMGGIGAGQQMAARAQQLQQAKQMQPYMVQQAAEKVPFMQAQEQKMQQQAQQGTNPLFASTGGGLSGAARSYMYAAHQWGENDPRTQMLKQSYLTQQKSMQQRGDYYGSNVEDKYLTPEQKLLLAQKKGITGAGGGLTPHQSDVVSSSLLKRTQSAQQQKQRLWSGAADKLYNNITPLLPSVEKFTGVGGTFKKIKDKGEAFFGIDPKDKDYNNLLTFKKKIPALAKELSRVYGSQATDKATTDFLKIASDEGNLRWLTPNQVGQLWNALGELVHTGTVATKMSPAQQQQPVALAQTPDSQQQAAPSQQPPQQGQQQGGMVTMLGSDGNMHSIPANKEQEALKRGWKHG